MPIRINLLAEAQLAEDLRRRDPVKRAIIAGVLLVVVSLVWSSSLQLAVMLSKSELARVQSTIAQRTAECQKVLDSQKMIFDARAKLEMLQNLTGSRFLQGNFMNALQQLKYDDVQLMRVKLEQSFVKLEAAPNKTGSTQAGGGRPSMVAEKIHVTLDARDTSANPGDKINKFKEAIASQPYFNSNLNPTNGVQLVSLSPVATGPDGKPGVLFTVDWNLPQKNR
jgi:hypothetical protein